MYPDDSAYYWIRAAEELERAQAAASEVVAQVHNDLARRYGTRAAKMGAGSPNPLVKSRPSKSDASSVSNATEIRPYTGK